MRVTRIYVDSALEPDTVVGLSPDTATHVARVLRGRVGDAVVLFNGDGHEYAAAIDSVRGNRVNVAVGAGAALDRESPLAITLVQCVPRGDRMDFVMQKATELGVARVVPVLSQRSVVRLDDAQGAAKVAHWRAVAISACEQCGRNRLPIIDAPQQLLDYLGGLAADSSLRLVLDPEGVATSTTSATRGGAAEVAVGPEGGFASDEIEAFRLAGFLPLRLGPRVLRTETAALAAVCWLQTRSGDMN